MYYGFSIFYHQQMWSQPCAHVIFDTDPAPRGGHEPAKPEEMCQAMIRWGIYRISACICSLFYENDALESRFSMRCDNRTICDSAYCTIVLPLCIFVFSRGMVDVHGDQFVAYFLPENETLGKRKRDQEEGNDYTEGDELVLTSTKIISVRVLGFTFLQYCRHFLLSSFTQSPMLRYKTRVYHL